jgi:hypothetical protein
VILPACPFCGGLDHGAASCPRFIKSAVFIDKAADFLGVYEAGGRSSLLRWPDPPPKPLEDRIREEWGVDHQNHHCSLRILNYLCQRPDLTTTVDAIVRNVYERRTTGPESRNTRRTVNRQLRILARKLKYSPKRSFYITISGRMISIVDCTRIS